MKRALVLLSVLACTAAGAVAQEALTQEDPTRDDVVQVGVLYSGSICSENQKPGYSEFFFRVTRRLQNGWVETEYTSNISHQYGRVVFKPWPKPLRLNLAQVCSIQILGPTD